VILYREALTILEEIAKVHSLSDEWIDLDQSLGRILSEPVLSQEGVPSFNNSAMDGFALRASDTFGATSTEPVRLLVSGLIAAGDSAQSHTASSAARSWQAIEIMTGAPMPEGGGFDAVVRIEDVKVIRSPQGMAQSIEVFKPAKPGDNVRLKGTDYSVGSLAVNVGTRLDPEHILACASLGVSKLKVKSLPKVIILSTGSELIDFREKTLSPGMIRNSTGPFLTTALKKMGFEASYLGVVRDDPQLYQRMLRQAIDDKGADIVISTGAVSMGKYDFVSDVLKEMNAKIHFHKAAIRPGKPILFAELNDAKKKRSCAFFGVPGNPVSTAVGLRFFIEPYIRSLLSLPREKGISVQLSRDASKPAGLRCFFKGQAKATENGVIEVEALKGQASYIVSALLDANAWVVLPEQGTTTSKGTLVEIYPLHNSFEKGLIL